MPYFTSRKRTAYRFVGAVTLAVFERTSQKYIHNATYKRQAEHFLADIDKQAQECMERLTAQMKQSQCNRTVKVGKCLRVDKENE